MSGSTLVNEEIPPAINQHTRRLAFIIPLSSSSSPSSSSEISQSSSGSTQNSNTRSVLLLIFMVPSSSTSTNNGNSTSPLSGLGGIDFLDILRRDEDDAYHELLNRLMQSFVPRGPPPTSKSFVEELPKISMNAELQKEAIRCPVCLMDYDLEEEVLQLPCKHVYHNPCITTWLKQANTCCVCRHELPKEEEKDKIPSNEQIPSIPSNNSAVSNEDEEMPPLISERDGSIFRPPQRENELDAGLREMHSDFNSRLRDLLGMPLLDILNPFSRRGNRTIENDDEILMDIPNLFHESTIPIESEISSSTVNNITNELIVNDQVQTFPSSSPRVLEDDDHVESPQHKRKGPLNWVRKQINKFSCLRGLL